MNRYLLNHFKSDLFAQFFFSLNESSLSWHVRHTTANRNTTSVFREHLSLLHQFVTGATTSTNFTSVLVVEHLMHLVNLTYWPSDLIPRVSSSTLPLWAFVYKIDPITVLLPTTSSDKVLGNFIVIDFYSNKSIIIDNKTN